MQPGRAILEAFYRAGGQPILPGVLARRLGLSAKRIATEIAELQQRGYHIESHPHDGYRLLSSPDLMTSDDIKARLSTRIIGSEIIVFEETGSTNDVVAQLASSGASEGLVVFAESQTRGRGRHGRAWASPRGRGLWFSVLLRPSLPPTAAQRLTVAASVAVARTIRQTAGVDARIKWPNDVTVRGRKLAGILTELVTRANAAVARHNRSAKSEHCAAVLGVGIDVNCEREDFPREVAEVATSLRIETGKLQDRAALAAQILGALDDAYRMASADFDRIMDEWASLCTTLGKHVVVGLGRRRIEGYAQALADDGALLIRKDNGQTERIVGGDLIKEQA